MKIISCNVNGIRAAVTKELPEFITDESPDIFCAQEIKADLDSLPKLDGYSLVVNCADKKGYSGVAVYSKSMPVSVINSLGHRRLDSEGRYLQLDFGDFTLINIYVPHGGRAKENLGYKLEVYQALLNRLATLNGKRVVVVGDFNIANQDIDLSRPQQNRNNIMFTDEERLQLNKIIGLGYIDSFRRFNSGGENYTWWPYAFNAYARNMGWRIDYVFVSNSIQPNLAAANIYRQYRFSDHCPIGVII